MGVKAAMKARVHRKEPLQMFPTTMEIKDFINTIRFDDKPDCQVIATTKIKGQTNFYDTLDKPHPRIHVEILLFWLTDKRMLGFGVVLRSVEYHVPCLRYCLESYITNDKVDDAKWSNGMYFGEESRLRSILKTPLLMWRWFVNPITMNITNQHGKPIGNLNNFLVDGTLHIRVELLVMTNVNVLVRMAKADLLQEETTYMELHPNRYRSPLEMLYKEFGTLNITVHSYDRQAYFVCHRKVLSDHSRVLRKLIQAKDACGRPVRNVTLHNVSTDSLRVILFYIYHNRVYPKWYKFSLDLMASCVNLELDPLIKVLLNDLRTSKTVSHDKLDEVWDIVNRYSVMVAAKAEKMRIRTHTSKLHPGVPCNKMCSKHSK